MTNLDPDTYFQHLRAYVNDQYIIHRIFDTEVILPEHYFTSDNHKKKICKVCLILPDLGFVFKLDHDQFGHREKSKQPLFHFLDDTSKPWSKRCDLVIFYVNHRNFYADCIEFKSGSILGGAVREQLPVGACWVKSLKTIIEHYTGDSRRICVSQSKSATQC